MATLASNTIGVVNPEIRTVGALIRAIRNFFSDSEAPNLENLKQEIETKLNAIAESDSTFKILVLIDDLDRLDPDDSMEVIRLVKAVGDFPAVTYLLAYDRLTLSNAISKSAKIDDGSEYLEKIIQFSFKVPPLEPFQLRNWLKSEMENLYPDDADYASQRARIVFDTWAGRLLRTPRDVRRLVLAVRTIWPALRNKADLLDFIWLQMIKEKASQAKRDLYGWTARYLQSLDAIAIGGHVTGQKRDEAELERILKELGWHTYEKEEEKMSFDFHHLDELLAGVTQSYLGQVGYGQGDWLYQVSEEELQKFQEARRLSSPWHWRLYFALDTPSHALTDDEWTALKDAASVAEEKLGFTIEKILDLRPDERRNIADQILERVSYAQRSGTLANAYNWLITTVRLADTLRKGSGPDPFGFDKRFDMYIGQLVENIFQTLSPEERKSAINKIFMESVNLSVSAELIRRQMSASKEGGSEDSEKVFLSETELEPAMEAQRKQYEALTSEDFRKLGSPYDVLFAWSKIAGAEPPGELLEKAFKANNGLVETLETLRRITSSAQNGIPHVPEKYLADFVDVKKVKGRLKKISKGKSSLASRAQALLGVWWSKER